MSADNTWSLDCGCTVWFDEHDRRAGEIHVKACNPTHEDDLLAYINKHFAEAGKPIEHRHIHDRLN